MSFRAVLASSILYLIGFAIGHFVSVIFLPEYQLLCELFFIILSFMLFTTPVFRFLGWDAPPPRCRICSSARYTLIERKGPQSKWKCINCEQAMSRLGDTITFMDESGAATSRVRLRWPKVLGRWR